MAMTIRPDGTQQPVTAPRTVPSFDAHGALSADEPKEANLQQAAWDLGHDKKLTGRIERELSKQAYQLAAQDSGATVKDFADDTVAKLRNFSVGEEDAKALVDAYVQQDLHSTSDDTTALSASIIRPPRPDGKMLGELFVSIEDGKPVNPSVKDIVDAYDKAGATMTKAVQDALSDASGAYILNQGMASTVGDFSRDLQGALRQEGLAPEFSRRLVDEWLKKAIPEAKADEKLADAKTAAGF